MTRIAPSRRTSRLTRRIRLGAHRKRVIASCSDGMAAVRLPHQRRSVLKRTLAGEAMAIRHENAGGNIERAIFGRDEDTHGT
jgi:hypothetical protein